MKSAPSFSKWAIRATGFIMLQIDKLLMNTLWCKLDSVNLFRVEMNGITQR